MYSAGCAFVGKLTSHLSQLGLADLELFMTLATSLVSRCLSPTPLSQNLSDHYLDGPCGYLDMVQPSQRTLSVDEVGGCQLMQGLQGHGRAVPTASDYWGTSCCLCLSAQFPLVHKNGQGLFSYSEQCVFIGEAFCSLIPSQ